MKKILFSTLTIAALSIPTFALSKQCIQTLQTLKKDLSNLTDEGAQCFAKLMVEDINSKAKMQKNAKFNLHAKFENNTVIISSYTKQHEAKHTTSFEKIKKTILEIQCKNPSYQILFKHGIKIQIYFKTPERKLNILLSKKTCHLD